MHKVMFHAEFGDRKSRTLLSYSEQLTYPQTAISFDYERGQDNYVVTKPELAKKGGPWYVERIIAPSVYEILVLMECIKHPEVESSEWVIQEGVIKKPVDWKRVDGPTKTLLKRIHTGEIIITTLLFDTMTRLCEVTTTEVFGRRAEKSGEAYVEKMSQVIWGEVKDNISSLLFQAIKLDLNLVGSSWAKNEWDQKARKSTSNLVADVLKNVHAFFDLEVLLTRNPAERGKNYLPPQGTVLKSRLESLPTGIFLPECTWENILAAHPTYEDSFPEDHVTTRDLSIIVPGISGREN